ncbi:hypothetical protein M422DRAFT_264092 [Sphaerobolus stellatus SS14]|uniref:Uncharacterized protein n=1 Tax=Sphaerobolus stellatus (strain SS14) TaxID=990650 RepID=A0A0C9TUD5_SPHS4|nr:hypothetical protein M422DRAFT_264092 [Sphaerobolus stellatus SS14]
MNTEKHRKSISSSLLESIHDATLYSEDPPVYTSLYDEYSLSLTETTVSLPLWPTTVPRILVKIFGSVAVDYFAERIIKKRLANIGSHLQYRLSSGSLDAFTDLEAEKYNIAYGDIVYFSQSKYNLLLGEVVKLRIDILKALIQSQTSILDDVWQVQSAARVLNELQELLAVAVNQAEIHRLRHQLIEKISHELLDEKRLKGPKSGEFMSGVRITKLLCHDLAYGQGNYAVQAALCRIAAIPWGEDDLRKLDEETVYVLDCVKRLLLEFNNPYSTSMTFQIFGRISKTSPKLGKLMVKHGVTPLICSFQSFINTGFQDYKRFYLMYKRAFQQTCIALTAAMEIGYAPDILENNIYDHLVNFFKDLNKRDQSVIGGMEEERYDDQDIKQDQLAACQFIFALSSCDDGKEMLMSSPDVFIQTFRKFACHCNRIYSSTELRREIRLICSILPNPDLNVIGY